MSEPREYEDGAFYWVTRDEISTVVRFDGEVGGFDCFGSFSDETLDPEQLRSSGYKIGPCIGKEPPRIEPIQAAIKEALETDPNDPFVDFREIDWLTRPKQPSILRVDGDVDIRRLAEAAIRSMATPPPAAAPGAGERK